MTLRCSFITSSYLRTFLRISALRCSTVFCARSMALVTMRASIGTSSSHISVFDDSSITRGYAAVAKVWAPPVSIEPTPDRIVPMLTTGKLDSRTLKAMFVDD